MRILLIGVLSLLVLACAGEKTPEAAIRDRIESMAQAAEDGKLDRLADGLSVTYRDVDGHDRDEIVRQMQRVLLLVRNLTVSTDIQALAVQTPEFATARVKVRLLDVEVRRLDFARETLTFELELALEADEQWRIVNADWTPKYPVL